MCMKNTFYFVTFLKEAPQSANLFGTYIEGPIFVGVECLSGLTLQYEASLVSLNSELIIVFEEVLVIQFFIRILQR